jgi:cation diffusion facilitator CzcD-associated flavoprotein CzcO
LAQHWNAPHGTKTYLGMSVSGFPNLFFTYGPQAPTAFCNGPTCAELQGGWIKGVMGLMRERGLRRVEARAEREEEWTEGVWKVAGASLLTGVDSVGCFGRWVV